MRTQEDTTIHVPRRRASGGASPAVTWISDLQPPDCLQQRSAVEAPGQPSRRTQQVPSALCSFGKAEFLRPGLGRTQVGPAWFSPCKDILLYS